MGWIIIAVLLYFAFLVISGVLELLKPIGKVISKIMSIIVILLLVPFGIYFVFVLMPKCKESYLEGKTESKFYMENCINEDGTELVEIIFDD